MLTAREKGNSEKEQFLRHPSIGSKRKGHPKENNAETQGTRSSIFSLGASMQFFNSFVHQPRAASPTVPVVIVTPSTPTRDIFPVAEFLPPPLSSPPKLANPTAEPSHRPPTRSIFEEETGELSLAFKKQVSVSTDVENDISDIDFDSWVMSVPQEAGESSFSLPESLQKITFEPIRCASHALSAVSDMLHDIPSWKVLEADMPLYFTSTPPRRRRLVEKKSQDIENNYVEATVPPSHDASYQCVDPIPYPDVFDLDMYYDPTIPLRKKLYNRDFTFKNTLHLQNDDLIDPPPCERPSDDCKQKDGMAVSSVISISFPVACERDFKSCISQSFSTGSLLKNINSPTPLSLSLATTHSPQQHPSSIMPLDESTNTLFRSSTMTSSPSFTLYSIEKSPATHMKSQLKLRSVFPASAYTTRSRSNLCRLRSRSCSNSEQESDVGSMDALHARLRDPCDSLPLTEEREVWEPVSF